MKRALTFIIAIVGISLAVGITGCGPLRIAMNPSAVADMEYKRIPSQIIIFMDSEFRNYHWQGFSDAELRGLDYDLGTASRNLFYDTFKQLSDNVTVVETQPAFPMTGSDGIILIVHPLIGGFSEKHSLFIRNANYYATIKYHIIVYDNAGNIMLNKDYTATGIEMGYTNLYRNYAAPAEKAMAAAVKNILDDIIKLASSQSPNDKTH